ncbi:NACHT, LRR and PYD domains-containing protein 5-like [Pelmatolapia mariae]|uniref:NACHT, LRR and PYD domains-containing protein 5-like n=1 Tax=Pelmatolapia mariae TaxID=158779 RepID=UPI003211EB26
MEEEDGAGSAASSCVSVRSDWSKEQPPQFSNEPAATIVEQEGAEVSTGQSAQQHQTHLDSVVMRLEDNITMFVKNELKKIQKLLSPDHPETLKSQMEDEEMFGGEDEDERKSCREAFLKITLHFLRRLKQHEMADHLQSKIFASLRKRELKAQLKKKFQCVFEGIAKAGSPTLLNQIYTELHITEGGTAEVNDEHEVRQIETASRKPDRAETTIRHEDIFKVSPGRDEPIRTVLTKGVAGIGKTVLTQKYSLDWAEDKANQDIQFIFPFTFRELNVLKEEKFSLVELVHHFFNQTNQSGICRLEDFQVVFILDGLDECRLNLDFKKTKILTETRKSTSLDELLTNLIRGNLLPSARLWITTRPAAAYQIPPQCVDMVTECAVDKALQSPNGHLDLFLRFLLGLKTNQTRLQGLMTQTGSSAQTNQEAVKYIKKKLNKLSPAQWSALVFILLSSEKDLDEFNLQKCFGSEEALLRLLPVVKVSKKAL